MLRGLRHTLFLLLQIGVIVSGGLALILFPSAWPAIAICSAGALFSSLICERMASHYLRRTLGELRRATEDVSQGRTTMLEVSRADDFHKLVRAINEVARRLADTSAEEKRLQEELRRRERLAFLGELAATVAHEINNPLDGVQSCTRILRRSMDDPVRAAHMLELIDDGHERIEIIVRRLLTLARENVIRPVQVSVREIVDAALRATESRIAAASAEVRRAYCDGPDTVLADPHLLQQVFVNLVLNAVDSMSAGGTLTVIVRREPRGTEISDDDTLQQDAVAVEVRDCGAGIPAEILPHIFEPFFTTKKAGRGTGLGLPIAARIMDAHHGTISVQSVPGQGTVFTVRLAQRAGAPRPTSAAERPTSEVRIANSE